MTLPSKSHFYVDSATPVPEARQAAERAFVRTAESLTTLWSLSAEWDRLIAALEDPDQDPVEIDLLLDELAGDIKTKSYGVAVVIRQLEKLAEWQKDEARRLAEKARANESHANRVRAYALACMKALGTDRIDTGSFALSVRTNPAAVNVLDASAVPSEFNRTTITVSVDKRGILEHVKATGLIPPGVEITRGERLNIA